MKRLRATDGHRKRVGVSGPRGLVLTAAGVLAAASLMPAAGGGSSILGAEELDLAGVIEQVLESDTSLEIARESVTGAYHRYRLAKAPGYPQVSLTAGPVYGLSLRRDYDFDTFGESFSGFDITDPGSFDVELPRRTTLTHSWNAGVEFSQLLPTGGSASVAVGNRLDYITLPEEDDPAYFSQYPELSVGLSQPVFVGGRLIDGQLLRASTRIAEIGWEQSRETERSLKSRVVLAVSDLFIRLLSLKRSREFTEDRLELARDQLRQAQIDAEQGRISANQVLGLEVSINRRKEALLDLSFAELQTRRELASMLGKDDLDGVSFLEDIPSLQLRIDAVIEELRRKDPDNPDLRSKLLTLEQAEWQARVNGREGAPRVGINFALAPRYRDDRDLPNAEGSLAEAFEDFSGEGAGVNFSFGVQVNVPITDGGMRKARRDADQSARALARLEVKQVRDDIQDRIGIALERDRILRQRLELVRVDTTYQKNRLDRVRRLAEARSATGIEVDGAALEYTAALNTLRETEADILLNGLQLLSFYGYPVEKVFAGAE